MKLGYVGLGNMGGALARRLMRQHKMRVFDLNPKAMEAFVQDGAIPSQNLKSLAAESDFVMTCLPTSNHVEQAIFGEGGLAEGLEPGSFLADMTTGDPVMTREMAARLREKGVTMIDAPVSGGPHGANAGTIAILVGAPDDAFVKIKPVFEVISPNIFHCGDVGNGHVMKLVNNVILGGIRAITFEAIAMGVKNGLKLEQCAEVLPKCSGRSSVTDNSLPKMVAGDKSVSFTLELMHKDVRLATQLGLASTSPMPVSGLVREIFQSAINEVGEKQDVNAMIAMYERLSGVEIAP
jgi:3-hydroxyisobutyrate dehydrogenase